MNQTGIYHSTGGEVSYGDKPTVVRVVVDANVKEIDYSAFYGCVILQSIDLPDGLEAIGGCAFYNCSSLTSITLPDGLKKIGRGTFAMCSSLKTIVLPRKLTLFGAGVFAYCTSLVSITLPAAVVNIERVCISLFSKCNSLASINMPSSSPDSHEKHIYNSGQLFALAVNSMKPQNKASWARTHRNDDGRSPLMTAAALSLKWNDMEPIFIANQSAIEEFDDVVTGLPVSMLAAVGKYSDLESVYHLCMQYPIVLIQDFKESVNECTYASVRKRKRQLNN